MSTSYFQTISLVYRKIYISIKCDLLGTPINSFRLEKKLFTNELDTLRKRVASSVRFMTLVCIRNGFGNVKSIIR